MGNKANPRVMRLGIVDDWDSNWFATSDYSQYLLNDFNVRKYVNQHFSHASISNIKINRKIKNLTVLITVARPGIILGKKGLDLELHINALSKITNQKVKLSILEEKNPEKSAKLVADWAASQLEKRVPFRRVIKMAIQKVLKAGAEGVKVHCSGRLGGAEIARKEGAKEGSVPLHTLRSKIDYGFSEANTTFGKIGIKVWVNNGDTVTSNKLWSDKDVDAKKD
tara:strand:- start:186 stop:857 length:672 start_codon:yes stop_codon:yes gene_type:complete